MMHCAAVQAMPFPGVVVFLPGEIPFPIDRAENFFSARPYEQDALPFSPPLSSRTFFFDDESRYRFFSGTGRGPFFFFFLLLAFSRSSRRIFFRRRTALEVLLSFFFLSGPPASRNRHLTRALPPSDGDGKER